MEDFLTAQEAASLLHLHVKRVQALARAGQLPGTRIGRKWLFPRSRLMARLGPSPGSEKEAEVEISARNQLRGRVTAIALGCVMAEVRGQIGTDLPLIVGMIIAAKLDSASVLVLFGAMQVLTALRYRMPMPVQPLKAVAALVITQKLSGGLLYGGGLAIGLLMLTLTLTG